MTSSEWTSCSSPHTRSLASEALAEEGPRGLEPVLLLVLPAWWKNRHHNQLFRKFHSCSLSTFKVGLLQQPTQWCSAEASSTTTACSKCCCQSGYEIEESGSYHSHSLQELPTTDPEMKILEYLLKFFKVLYSKSMVLS